MQYGPETIFMVEQSAGIHTGSGNTAGNTPDDTISWPWFFSLLPQEGHFPFTALPNNGQRVGIGVFTNRGKVGFEKYWFWKYL